MDQKYVFFWNWLFTLSLIFLRLLQVVICISSSFFFFPYFWIVFHKEINPEYYLEGLSLRLQCFGHLMQRVDSLEKILMLGKIEGRKRKGGGQWMRWLDGIINSVGKLWANFEQTLRDSGGQRSLACCRPWGHKKLDTIESLNNSSDNTWFKCTHWRTIWGLPSSWSLGGKKTAINFHVYTSA